MTGLRRVGPRFRFRRQNHPEPSNISVKARGIDPGGSRTGGAVLEVTGAVVATVTINGCDAPPVSCSDELDKLQVGAGVTLGVMAQLRLAVPVNEAAAARTSEKLAFCPALTVCDVPDPEAAPIVKSDEMVRITPVP
jgi:hypothetical protein